MFVGFIVRVHFVGSTVGASFVGCLAGESIGKLLKLGKWKEQVVRRISSGVKYLIIIKNMVNSDYKLELKINTRKY